MPRYFFDVFSGRSEPDEVGLEMPGIEFAHAEVRRALSEMATLATEADARQLRIDVRDEAGNYVILGTLTMIVQRLG